MKLSFSDKAVSDYQKLPKSLRKAADKQFNLLLRNLKHPSLHAKKYDESMDVWQARISKSYRVYFRIVSDVYQIITIVKHPK